jgi:hypothetical protein
VANCQKLSRVLELLSVFRLGGETGFHVFGVARFELALNDDFG